MKKVVFSVAILIYATSFTQNSGTSFEDPEIFTDPYTDTGDASVAHDLVNNPNEALVDHMASGSEIGFNARYVPYDTPGIGLTDGDDVGVIADPPNNGDPFPHGDNGYMISDVDGNFIVEFDPVLISSPTISIDFFISETGYEGDGTINASGSDRLRIYVKDISNSIEYDLLDTTGNDINNLGIEGAWITATSTIPNSPNITIQLIIEARNNSGAEAFYFDNLNFDGILGIEPFNNTTFKVYPNPSRNKIHISPLNLDGASIVLYDILGLEVMNTKLVDNTLDISNVKSGLYLLKISQGTTHSTQKIVVR